MTSTDRSAGHPKNRGKSRLTLPPRPEFTPADIKGNLAEARLLRTIGTGQPIKASWLCRETLEIYRRNAIPPDLDLVDALRVLALCYTDDVKRGNVAYVLAADEVLDELAAFGGIPHAAAVHRRCRQQADWDTAPALAPWRVKLPPPEDQPSPAAAPGPPAGLRTEAGGSAEFFAPHLGLLLARLPRGSFPLQADEYGCLEPERIHRGEILIAEAVRRQSRFECLYLRGLVGMSQALRIERSGQGAATPSQLQNELPYLVEAAWWFHLAGLVARDAPEEPTECFRRARAKSSMLIRRVDAGKHFEMPSLEEIDLGE